VKQPPQEEDLVGPAGLAAGWAASAEGPAVQVGLAVVAGGRLAADSAAVVLGEVDPDPVDSAAAVVVDSAAVADPVAGRAIAPR